MSQLFKRLINRKPVLLLKMQPIFAILIIIIILFNGCNTQDPDASAWTVVLNSTNTITKPEDIRIKTQWNWTTYQYNNSGIYTKLYDSNHDQIDSEFHLVVAGVGGEEEVVFDTDELIPNNTYYVQVEYSNKGGQQTLTPTIS